MSVRIEGPSTSASGLDELADLYATLHSVHLAKASYGPLVQQVEISWIRRRALYTAAIEAQRGVYFVARDDAGRAVGYAFAVASLGADDTFDSRGIVELVTLVVARGDRRSGVGRALVGAVEDQARHLGADTIKVGVMVGNDEAHEYYLGLGYRPGETLLYRSIG